MINKTAAAAAVGCKVNKYEAHAMLECLKQAGYTIVDFSDKADVYIINTCTVTNTSDKKSRQLIRRAKQINSDAIVVVAGCYSQLAPDEACDIDGVNIVLGTKGHTEIDKIVDKFIKEGARKRIIVSDIKTARAFESASIKSFRNKTRAYVKIEDGCDNFCSYCIIPYARGRVRSRPPEDILFEISSLSAAGVNEIVLTGIHVASYGKDLDNISLTSLVKKIKVLPGINRFRLSSLEPGAVTDEFIKTLASFEGFCDYFHLSLQSGCDKTLNAMDRKYGTREYKEAVNKIYGCFSHGAVWSDVIAGFPGETNDDFEKSCEFIKKSGIVKLHIFPYSPKKGTKAALMDNQVSDGEKKLRMSKLKEIDSALYNEFLGKNIGLCHRVFFEKKGADGYYYGHTKNYISVKVKSGADITNKILTVKPDSVLDGGVVFGKIIHDD